MDPKASFFVVIVVGVLAWEAPVLQKAGDYRGVWGAWGTAPVMFTERDSTEQ